MARPGDVIENPKRGERAIFRETSRETGGEFIRIEGFHEPRALGPIDHIHPKVEERFEVLEGTLRFRVGGEIQIARAGRVPATALS